MDNAGDATVPQISVIIPTLNRQESLRTTLETLVDQSLAKDRYEIIVVNDGSSDATTKVCRSFAGQVDLRVVEHAENLGISAAKNTGILAARGRLLLFFDDDDAADRLLLEEHVKAHEQHPQENIGVLGYTTWAPTLTRTPLMRYVTDVGGFLFAYGNLKDGALLDFTYFWGGRSSCKRSFLAKHGVFNRQFRSIIEDMELGYRLSHFGFRVVFHRAAVSYMTRAVTLDDVCKRCERQGEALYLFGKLHADPVVQEYCRLADPFVDNRHAAVDPEARWQDIASSFHEKVDQAKQLERVVSWGFEPEVSADADERRAAKAQAYESQMRELFHALEKAITETGELHRKLAEQEAAYQAELKARHATYKAEEQRRDAEAEELREVNRFLQSKAIIVAEQEQLVIQLTNRLRTQLWSTRKLVRLLEDAEKAAERLRSSRRWKLANPAAAVRAAVAGKDVPGYGHLERIVALYSEWRESHPEVDGIDEEIKSLAIAGVASSPSVDLAASGRAIDPLAPATPPPPVLPIESIQFPKPHNVDVSIVIPVYNQFQFTHACLASLQQVEEPIGFEVIVVDDASEDQTSKIIPQIPGIVYLRNETNAGFIVSCNRGAAEARGKYVMFLNNDTIVTKGWLTSLVETFANDAHAGIAGSKLVYADGRLQEAGGIIWRDASGWNYGKFDDPQKPQYNYLREVDYCSAAALMIPKALFDEVGGFDPRYAPAYYEDTDLSFKVRSRGYRVLYQPASEVIHYEGATGGTDVSSGTKKHQEINRAVFAARWAAELRRKPQVGDVALVQQPPAGCKNVLVIDHYVPMPDRDSGSLRMFQILRLLRQLGHHVTFVPDNLAKLVPYTAELQKLGIEVWYHPYIRTVREYLQTYGTKFDVVILSRCDFARKHIDDVRRYAPQGRVIFDTVDLHFVREDRHARLTNDPAAKEQAAERQRLEHSMIEQADETWVVSPAEQALLRESLPTKRIEVVSNIVETPGGSAPFERRRDWLFIGSFQHPPNIDAMLYFLREIYPLVQARLDSAKFYIIGEKVPREVVELANESVIVTGVQCDVLPFFERARLSVAPLRYGAGVKGKINQSMALGVPVVATSVAIEGMELTPDKDVLVADDAAQFAEAIARLYHSEELWRQLSANGLNQMRANYSPDAARRKLQSLFSDEHVTHSPGKLSPLTEEIAAATHI